MARAIMAAKDYEMYSGENSYKYMDNLIKEEAGELMIISPYISNFYTRKLIKAAQGKKIRVITSISSIGYRNAIIGDFLKQSANGYMKAMLFFVVLDLISAYIGFAYTTAALTVITVLAAILAYRRFTKTESNMQVKVVKGRFVHEKLYIGSSKAISGSANLTYNGMHRNIEHIEVTSDPGKISELKSHFEAMWSNS